MGCVPSTNVTFVICDDNLLQLSPFQTSTNKGSGFYLYFATKKAKNKDAHFVILPTLLSLTSVSKHVAEFKKSHAFSI